MPALRRIARPEKRRTTMRRCKNGLRVYVRDTSRSSTTIGPVRHSGRSTARKAPIEWRSALADAMDAIDGQSGYRSRAPAKDCAMIVCRSATELERMREAGRLVGEVLAELASKVGPGVSTAELDDLAEKRIAAAAARRRSRAITGTRRRSARRSTTK